MPPRIAKGVPAATPHAPATITTEMVDQAVAGNEEVDRRRAEGEVDQIACESRSANLSMGARERSTDSTASRILP